MPPPAVGRGGGGGGKARLHFVCPSIVADKHGGRDAPWCVRSTSTGFKTHLTGRNLRFSRPLKVALNTRFTVSPTLKIISHRKTFTW